MWAVSSASVSGGRVITSGQVISGAGSPGQQVWIGRRPRSTSPPSRRSAWQSGRDTGLGRVERAARTIGQRLSASRTPSKGSGSRRAASISPSSPTRDGATPNPAATRSAVPNRLARTGILAPSAFSNMSAGPPARRTRRCTSVMSWTRLIGSPIRARRRRSSRNRRKALRSRKAGRSRNDIPPPPVRLLGPH